MADFWYNNALRAIMKGEINLDTADLRVVLCMTNTTADTEKDKALMNAFTTLDEHDGTPYARQVLADTTVTQDDVNNRAELDFTDPVFSLLGAGTRQVAGAMLYVHVTDDTDSIPLAWSDSGGFPITPPGTDFTLVVNAEGAIHLQG